MAVFRTNPIVLLKARTALVVLLGTLTLNLLLNVTISLIALRSLVFRLLTNEVALAIPLLLMFRRLIMTPPM